MGKNGSISAKTMFSMGPGEKSRSREKESQEEGSVYDQEEEEQEWEEKHPPHLGIYFST